MLSVNSFVHHGLKSHLPAPPPTRVRTGFVHKSGNSWIGLAAGRRRLLLTRGKNIFKEVDRSLLPGNVPNTAWRRLLADIKDALSLGDLLRIYKVSARNTRVWQPRHDAAMLRKAAALTYYKSLSAPAPPSAPPALPGETGSSSSSSQGHSSGGSGGDSGAGASQHAELLGDRRTGVRASSEPLTVQLQQLLGLLCTGSRFGQAVRMVEGYRMAQLLVASTNLRTRAPPECLATLVGELLKDNSKKLVGCGTPLLAELVASLSRSIPYQADFTTLPGLPTTPPTRLNPSPQHIPLPASAPASLGPRVPLPPHMPSGLEAASPFEQQPPPLPGVHELVVRKHARNRPGLQRLVAPGERGHAQGASGAKRAASPELLRVDVARLWSELHRLASVRLQSGSVAPTDIARMAWGFAQAGYYDPPLFAALESALLPAGTGSTPSLTAPEGRRPLSLSDSSMRNLGGGASSLPGMLVSASSHDASSGAASLAGAAAGASPGAWSRAAPAVPAPLAPAQVYAWKSASDLAIPSMSTCLPQAPQPLANLAFAFARAGHASPEIMCAISTQFMNVCADAAPAHIAKICWACAASGYEDQRLQDALASHMLRAGYRFSIQEICTIAFTYSQWNRIGHLPLLEHLAQELLRPARPASRHTLSLDLKEQGDASGRPSKASGYFSLLHTSSNAELVSLARSLAGVLRPPLLDVLQRIVEARMQSLTEEELAYLLAVLLSAGCKCSAQIEHAIQELKASATQPQSSLSVRSRSELLFALNASGARYLKDPSTHGSNH